MPHLVRHERFASAFLPGARDLIVYLPPGYRARGRERFPVLYLQDGQNLFDPATAHRPGEHWRVGETADALIAARRLHPLVIVGIAHMGARRVEEYTLTRSRRHGGGRVDAYGRFVVEEVKPFVDRTYRTHPGRAYTGIGGSSLGALASLYLGLRYPVVFGRLALLSPSVWWGRRAILRVLARARVPVRPRIWLDIGTAEGRAAVRDARALRDALLVRGWREGRSLRYEEHEGAGHHEAAWAARVGPMLAFLFG